MPCLAASRASSWWAGLHTSFGPRSPNGWAEGSPSNMPSRIWTVTVLTKALSTSASLTNPFFMASWVWTARKGPQSKSKPAKCYPKNITLQLEAQGIVLSWSCFKPLGPNPLLLLLQAENDTVPHKTISLSIITCCLTIKVESCI